MKESTLPDTRELVVWLSLLAFVTLGSAVVYAAPKHPIVPVSNAQIMRNYGKLPLRFEENRGQMDRRAQFLARGKGYSLYLTEREAVLAMHGQGLASQAKTGVIRMQLVGANADIEPVALDKQPDTTNYLLGNQSEEWHTNLASYGRVRYDGIYKGIDLVYHGNQQQFEYDFIVAPGADTGRIRLHFAGVRALSIDASGSLVIDTQEGSVAFHKPVVYQTIAGRRKQVSGHFTLLADNSAGFAVGNYDHARQLVIDPTLVYSTFLGGSTSDSIAAVAVDSSGAAYLTGYTTSADYPVTPGVFQSTATTAFVTKLNASGTALVYSTFLGGTASGSPANSGNSIAVDSAGNAYVTGSTYSTTFPVTSGAFQKTNKAAAGNSSTSFLTKINPSGTGLVYSTYLGGARSDTAQSLVLDSSGNAYVAGSAYSNDFPTTSGAFQTTNKSYASYGWNEFVTKVNAGGSALLYSTMIGGSGDYGSPSGIRLAVDGTGNAFVTATVLSKDFPVTAGVFQATNKSTGRGNVTLAKVNPTATKLLYATYLGGTSSSYGDDTAYGLAVDSTGNAYVAGTTYETDYPITAGSYETTNKTGGVSKATGFVTKMNPTGTGLVYSTYFGGSSQRLGDYIYALALDGSGNVYLAGSTGSTDFPVTTGAYQTKNNAFNSGSVAFLSEMNSTGKSLLYSSYFGGANSYRDAAYGVALTSSGNVYVAGVATASDFPITSGAYKSNYSSSNGGTGFVAAFAFGAAPINIATTTNLTASANPVVDGTKVTFTVFVTPNKGTGIPGGNVVFSVDQKAVSTVALSSSGYAAYTTATPLALGQHAILASYGGSASYATSGGGLTESITPTAPLISPATGVYSMAQLVTVTDATANTTIYYTTNGAAPTASSTKYSAPILVSSSLSLQAVAVASGVPNSAVAAASYKLITAPSALAVPQTLVTANGATLNGLVNSFGMAGSYFFQYGTMNTALTKSTAKTALSGGVLGARFSIAPVPVKAAVTGLTTKTTYYYRVVIVTNAGTSSGKILSFTTN